MSRRPTGRGSRRFPVQRVASVPAWVPSDDAGLKLWLRPDMGVTLATTKVSAWASQAGDANVVQGTDANRPTFTATSATFNDQPVLTFAGSHYLRDALYTSIAQRYFVGIVARSTSGATQLLLDDGGGTADCPAIFYGTGTWRASSPNIINSTDTTLTGVRAHLFDANGASSAYYIDDFTTPKVSAMNAGTGATDSLTVGASSAAAGGLNGEIAEIWITTTTGQATRDLWRDYLNARYGLSIV